MAPFRLVWAFTLMATAVGGAHAEICFPKDLVPAARLRVLQQGFNVAALTCQAPPEWDRDFRQRYNIFVEKFDERLKVNATALESYFLQSHGNIDRWITVVANDQSYRAATDPGFCQQAANSMDQSMTVAAIDIETFAATAGISNALVKDCSLRTAPKRKKSG